MILYKIFKFPKTSFSHLTTLGLIGTKLKKMESNERYQEVIKVPSKTLIKYQSIINKRKTRKKNKTEFYTRVKHFFPESNETKESNVIKHTRIEIKRRLRITKSF